jgi:hypothetical protein
MDKAFFAAIAMLGPAQGPIMEATAAQHVDRPKGEPAKFIRNGNLEICQCRDCRNLAQGSPAEKLEVIRHKMKRLKETECRRSGKMDESLLYGLHGAVERYLAALAVPSTDRGGK